MADFHVNSLFLEIYGQPLRPVISRIEGKACRGIERACYLRDVLKSEVQNDVMFLLRHGIVHRDCYLRRTFLLLFSDTETESIVSLRPYVSIGGYKRLEYPSVLCNELQRICQSTCNCEISRPVEGAFPFRYAFDAAVSPIPEHQGISPVRPIAYSQHIAAEIVLYFLRKFHSHHHGLKGKRQFKGLHNASPYSELLRRGIERSIETCPAREPGPRCGHCPVSACLQYYRLCHGRTVIRPVSHLFRSVVYGQCNCILPAGLRRYGPVRSARVDIIR